MKPIITHFAFIDHSGSMTVTRLYCRREYNPEWQATYSLVKGNRERITCDNCLDRYDNEVFISNLIDEFGSKCFEPIDGSYPMDRS